MVLLRKLFIYFLSLITLAMFCWLSGLAWFFAQIPDQPTKDERITDAVVVLTGGSLRVEYGIDLLAAGKGKKLFISGVGPGVQVKDLFRNRQDKYLSYFNDDYYVILGREAADTKGNATEVAKWMQHENFRSMRLVTAQYHTPRSLYEFRRVMPDIEIITDPVFPVNDGIWWQSRDMRRLMLLEYHKFLLSFLHSKVTGL